MNIDDPNKPEWANDMVIQSAVLPWTRWQRICLCFELLLGYDMHVTTRAWTQHEAGRTEGNAEAWTSKPRWWSRRKAEVTMTNDPAPPQPTATATG